MFESLQHMMIPVPRMLDKGDWGDTTRWERHITGAMPPEALCSAAFCVAVKDDNIVLMRAERGWGMLGGHIELGESVVDAMHREAREEGGFVVSEYVFCGYRKIIANTPSPHPDPARDYPFPVSYVPFFLAITSEPLQAATGEEVLETAVFSINDVAAMNISDWPVVKAVWDIYAAHRLSEAG